MKPELTSHLEDYLETIYFLADPQGEVHASALADKMGVTRASVTGALRALSERRLIEYRPYQPVSLTPEGRRAAEDCAARHRFLHAFFRDQLGMPDAEAEEVACRVEHAANDTVLSRLAQFSRFLSECRRIDLAWSPEGELRCTREASACRDCLRPEARASEAKF